MLNRIAKYVVRKIHGHQRSPDDYLLTRRFYMDAEQELALGQSYLGLAGFPIFIVVLAYILVAYGYPGGGKDDAYGVGCACIFSAPNVDSMTKTDLEKAYETAGFDEFHSPIGA